MAGDSQAAGETPPSTPAPDRVQRILHWVDLGLGALGFVLPMVGVADNVLHWVGVFKDAVNFAAKEEPKVQEALGNVHAMAEVGSLTIDHVAALQQAVTDAHTAAGTTPSYNPAHQGRGG